MIRSPTIRRCMLPVLAVFVAMSTAPRAVLFAHYHAGGDRDHVHAWGEDAFDDHHHHDEAEPDQHHDHAGTGEVELGEPDGEHGEHSHVQVPFQLARQPPARAFFVGLLVRPVDQIVATAGGVLPKPAAPARGPPHLPLA